jgi:geranylgeranyl reductase family protein
VAQFDVAVIGAGPAGSLTAYRLARGGARVLLVDKAQFPRDKPCGGGLTMRAVKELPFSVEPVVEDVVTQVECRLGYGPSFTRAGGELALMTQRRRLDRFLVERAVDAGAEFRDGTQIDPLAAPADVVVGADGANGTTARTVGLGGDIVHGVALEGNVSHARVYKKRYAGRMVLEFGVVPGGYAWVFPKGDHVNVGVGGWGSIGPDARALLRDLCAHHAIDMTDVTETRGHRLPMRKPTTRLANDRALLVGDAAGLVDPVSGDGMYEAFVSARLAAESVLSGDLDAYEPALQRELARTLAASWQAKDALERFPRLVFGVARLPLVWGFVSAFLRGDLAHPGEATGLVRAPLRLVEALGASRHTA